MHNDLQNCTHTSWSLSKLTFTVFHDHKVSFTEQGFNGMQTCEPVRNVDSRIQVQLAEDGVSK